MPANYQLVPGAAYTLSALDSVPIDLTHGDVDFAAQNGPTGGYSPRAILMGAAGGILTVDTPYAQGRAIPVQPYQRVDLVILKVYSTSPIGLMAQM